MPSKILPTYLCLQVLLQNLQSLSSTPGILHPTRRGIRGLYNLLCIQNGMYFCLCESDFRSHAYINICTTDLLFDSHISAVKCLTDDKHCPHPRFRKWFRQPAALTSPLLSCIPAWQFHLYNHYIICKNARFPRRIESRIRIHNLSLPSFRLRLYPRTTVFTASLQTYSSASAFSASVPAVPNPRFCRYNAYRGSS